MDLLDHITRAIGERQDLRSIFQVVIRNVEESLPAQVCWIGLLGPESAGFTFSEEFVYEPDLRRRPVPLPQNLERLDPGCFIAAPLRGERGVIGVLLAARHTPNAFSSGETEFLRQLGEHVGLAVRQTQLHESLWTAYDETAPDAADRACSRNA